MSRPRRSGFGFGILLLAHKIFSIGLDRIPPVTLFLTIGQIALYLGAFNPPWDKYDVCISGESIFKYKDYKRLFLSAIEHSDDIHLYHNMISLIMKGRTLESRFGSKRFLFLIFYFIGATNLGYICLAHCAYKWTGDYSHFQTCAIGFSGVLFGLKVLTTYFSGNDESFVHGMVIPSKYAVWAELLIIHILVPRASFLGHLSGIVVGLLFIQGPLGSVFDILYGIIDALTGGGWVNVPYFGRPHYTYAHGYARREEHFEEERTQRNNQSTYGWNYEGSAQSFDYGSALPHEVRRRRLERFDIN